MEGVVAVVVVIRTRLRIVDVGSCLAPCVVLSMSGSGVKVDQDSKEEGWRKRFC